MTTLLPERQILSISQLNRRARLLLETHLPLLWIRGEVSNFARPGSGHWYLTLKDSDAQIRCAMFRNRNQLVRMAPKDGDQVLVRGRVGLYEARGDYQLIIEHMEADGAGLLQQQFEALKLKLQQEGLFDEAGKRTLPPYPSRIGIITSPTGAALRDILHVTSRRCPWVEINIYPTAVQGKEASGEIVKAITLANAHDQCDLLILARGGGSIEDLWAFNEEAVARAIHNSHIPILSAVGHETDFTIADFVADIRAPTPSAAAEIATPDRQAIAELVARYSLTLKRRIAHLISQQRQNLRNLSKRLRSPGDKLREQNQHLDHLEIRLLHSWNRLLNTRIHRFEQLRRRLAGADPHRQLQILENKNRDLGFRLQRALSSHLASQRQQLQGLAATLNAVSPLNTLERGYAIARDGNGCVVRSVDQIARGDAIDILLRDGAIGCVIESVSKSSS